MSDPSGSSGQQASSSIDSSSMDPSSLRLAALKTIHRKRARKLTEIHPASLPPRPQSSASVQLDYGSNDSPVSASVVSPTDDFPQPMAGPGSKASASPATKCSSTSEPSVDQTQREEGEISDAEDATTTFKQRPKLTLPSKPNFEPALPKSATVLSTSSSFADRMSVPTTPGASASSRAAIPLPAPPIPPPAAIPTSPVIPPNRYIVDEDYVRPGLAMNQSQYDTAKDIILDLLGWGVQPEDILGLGVSREIIFYVFSELRLRLPANLDTTGLAPFPLDPSVLATSASTAAQRHPLPRKPATAMSPSTIKPSTLGSPLSMASSSAPQSSESTTDLHGIERQRRNELLARKKAALASRRQKQTSATASNGDASPASSSAIRATNGTHDVDIVSPAAIAAPTPQLAPLLAVDDFLNSISGPASRDTVMAGSPSSNAQVESFAGDAMDVDEIPGLSHSRLNSSMSKDSTPSSASSGQQHPLFPSRVVDPLTTSVSTTISPSSDAIPADSSVSYGSSTLIDPPVGRSPVQSSGDDASRTTNGRGPKQRMVAADFVDGRNDGSTRSSRIGSPKRQGSAVSFAHVPARRRYVIDLSDTSGDEDDETESARAASLRDYRDPLSRRYSSREKSVPSSSTSAQESAERLNEGIRRIKEMIKQKELERESRRAQRSGGVTVSTQETESSTSNVVAQGSAEGFGDNEIPGLSPFSARTPVSVTPVSVPSSSSTPASFTPGSVTPTVSSSSNGAVSISNDQNITGPNIEIGLKREREDELMPPAHPHKRVLPSATDHLMTAVVPGPGKHRLLAADWQAAFADPFISSGKNYFLWLAISRCLTRHFCFSPSSCQLPSGVALSLASSHSAVVSSSQQHTIGTQEYSTSSTEVTPSPSVLSPSLSVSMPTPTAPMLTLSTPTVATSSVLSVAAEDPGDVTSPSTSGHPRRPLPRRLGWRSHALTDNQSLKEHNTTLLQTLSPDVSTAQVGEASHPSEPINSNGSYSSFAIYNSLFARYPLLQLSLDGKSGLGSALGTAYVDTSSTGSIAHDAPPPSPSESSIASSTHPSPLRLSKSLPDEADDESPDTQISQQDRQHDLPAPQTSTIPDLRPLQLATASKLLDPSKRICQYEIPGGGICRDQSCEDLHLISRRLDNTVCIGPQGIEPSDEDTAAYLSPLTHVDAEQLCVAIGEERARGLGFDVRVQRALHSLGYSTR
ncbi:hypothetical protein FISHEDRAFT_75338 [Fistulina hepatica ATCC 64428]|uniref:Zinc-finger domain-containing protein n=1 Tax=Fistulina hepatica ATCC 64428 TaxID=1128425 RepID=A0A0D7A7D0_9AGAR|nr:hypothetical protein FISHEDRAFT_75338 [Fistulina hepatica ATCC 64428]